jgi:hypothetical protein
MGDILDWAPLVWAIRIGLLGIVAAFLLLMARFFRPSSVRNLLRAPLPRVAKMEGEFAGAKGAVEFTAHSDALDALAARVSALEETNERLRAAGSATAEAIRSIRGGG